MRNSIIVEAVFHPDSAEIAKRKHERFVKGLRFFSTPLSLTAGMYASTLTSEYMMDPDRKACNEGLDNPEPGRGYNFIDSCQIAYNNWTIPRKFFAHLPDLYTLILSAVIANKGIIPLLTLAGRQLIKLKQITWRKWLKKEIKENIKPSELAKLPGKVAGGPWKALAKWIPATFMGVWGIELVKSIGRFLPFLAVIEVLHPWTVNIKKYGLFRDIIDQRQKVQNDFNSMLNWDEIPKEECILKEDPRKIAEEALYQYFKQGVDEIEEGLIPYIQNLFVENVDCPERDVREGLDYYSNKMKELRSLYLVSFFEEVQLWMNRIQETLLSYEMSKYLAFELYEYNKAWNNYVAETGIDWSQIRIYLPDRLPPGTYSIGQIEKYRNIVNEQRIETAVNQSIVENQEPEEAVLTEENQEETPVHPETMEIDKAYPFNGIGVGEIMNIIERHGLENEKAIINWSKTVTKENIRHFRFVLKYKNDGLKAAVRNWNDTLTLEIIQPYLDSAVAYLEKRGVPTADPHIVSQAVSHHFPYEYFNPHSSVPTGQTLSLIKTLLSCKSGVSNCVKHISAGLDLLVQTISKETRREFRRQNKGKLRHLNKVRNLLVCRREYNCSYVSHLKAYPVGLFWFETQKTGIQETILGHREQTREDSFFPYLFDSFEEDHVERIFYQMACGHDLKNYEPDMNLKISEISEDHIEELPLYEENEWGVENYTFNMPRLTAEPAPICDNTDYKKAFHQSFYWRGRYYANLLHYIKDRIRTNEKWWREKVEYQHIVASQYNAKVYKDTVVREHYIPAVTTEEQVSLLEISDSIEKIESEHLDPLGKLVFENIGRPLMVGLAEVGEHLFDASASSVDGITGLGSSVIDDVTTPGIRTLSSGFLENFREQAEFLFDMLERAYQDVLNDKVSIMQGLDCSQAMNSSVLADIDIKTHCKEDFKRYQEETGQTHLSIDTHRLEDGLIITKGKLIHLARENILTFINDLIIYNKEKLLEVEPSLQRNLLQGRQKEKDEINEEFQKRFSDISVLLRPLIFRKEGIVEKQEELNSIEQMSYETENSLQFLANNFETIIQYVQYSHLHKGKMNLVREDIMSDSGDLKGSTTLVYGDFEKFKELIWLIELLTAEEWESLHEKLQPFVNQDSRQIELQLKVLRKMSGQTTLGELEAYFKEIESIYTQNPHEVEQFRLALSEFQCTSTQTMRKQQIPKEISSEISEMFGSDCQDLGKIESLRIALKSLPAEKSTFRTAIESLYVFRDNPHLLFDFLVELESVQTFLSGSEEQKTNALKEIKAMREQIPLIREWFNQDNPEDVEKYLKFALILKGEVSTDTYLAMSLKKVLEQIQEKNFDQLRSLNRDIDLNQVFIEHPPLLEIAFIKDINLLKNLNSQQLLTHFKPQLNAIHVNFDTRFGDNLDWLVDECFAFDDINQPEGYKVTSNYCNRTLFKARDQVVITVMQSLHSLITELVQVNTQVDLVKTILSDAEEKEGQTIGEMMQKSYFVDGKFQPNVEPFPIAPVRNPL